MTAPRTRRGSWCGNDRLLDQPINGIEIEFTAGFGSGAELPPELKRAVLIHAAYLYEFRGAVTPDMQPAAIPAGYDRLIAPWLWRAL
ncbi:head-tail connector protein [Hoeflea alexandrii]|uniref:head-tail connector protein n=1 Tax=Hoeflea alexandrii TaxID=288436 RepID=UPI003CCDF94F